MANQTNKSKTKVYDAIVVGAGPSGASASIFLARAGYSVLLLDKAVFPREKICGDAFSGKSVSVMRDLGLLQEVVKHPHGIVRGVTMVAPNSMKVTVDFPPAEGLEFAGYTIARKDTDQILFTEATNQKNIEIIQDFQVTELVRDESGIVCGVLGIPNGSTEKQVFNAKVIIGADGAVSIISRKLSLPYSPPSHMYSAVRGYWKGVSDLSDNIELYFIDGVLPGYLWIFPMGDGLSNVGLGILSSDLISNKKHPYTILADAIAKHPALISKFKNATPVGKVSGWSIPNGSFVKPNFGDGWVVVGDAASLVDPFSGEGVGNALASGKYAAEAIIEAFKSDPDCKFVPKAKLEKYSHLVDVNLRPDMVNSYRLQKLSRYKFLLNLFIGKAATKPQVRQMIIDMLGSAEAKQSVKSPMFFLKLLLP